MALALYKTGFRELQKVFKRFLWGGNYGGFKKSLIAWEEITGAKEEVGIGILSFKTQQLL